MKKLLCLILLLIAGPAFAEPLRVGPPMVKGKHLSVTRANLRLSTDSNAPILDLSSDKTLLPVGAMVDVIDSAGVKITGRILAKGTGETLDTAMNASACANYATQPYDTFDGASATAFHAISDGTGASRAGTADELTYVTGALYKFAFSLVLTSGALPGTIDMMTALGGTVAGLQLTNAGLAAGANAYYGVATSTTTGVFRFTNNNASAGEFTLSNFAAQKVLTPSATGVTMNWTSLGAGFNYNDTAGYTVVIR